MLLAACFPLSGKHCPLARGPYHLKAAAGPRHSPTAQTPASVTPPLTPCCMAVIDGGGSTRPVLECRGPGLALPATSSAASSARLCPVAALTLLLQGRWLGPLPTVPRPPPRPSLQVESASPLAAAAEDHSLQLVPLLWPSHVRAGRATAEPWCSYSRDSTHLTTHAR